MSTLCTTDFPIYSVCVLDKGLFYIAGGGGKAKTGIPNVIEVYNLEVSDNKYVANRACRHDMGNELVMQSAVAHGESSWDVAASVGRSCHIYSIQCSVVNGSDSRKEICQKENEEKGESDEEKDSISLKKEEGLSEKVDKEWRLEDKEKGIETTDQSSQGSSSSKNSLNGFKILKTASVTTDTAVKDSCQNVARFLRSGERVITGGEDGEIRVWSLPVLKPKEVMKGHKAEITDVAVHPTEQLCVSISRDCTCRVWDLEQCTQLESFKWTQYGEYRFRACCFSEDGKSLFTLNIPLKWGPRKRQCTYVIKWDTTKWSQIKCVSMKTDFPTAMALSKDHVAVGNVNGDITVFTKDLKLFLKTKAVHTSFVTGLCFDCCSSQQSPLLLSISVDKQCCVTVIEKKGGSTMLFIFFLVLMVLIAVAIAHFNIL